MWLNLNGGGTLHSLVGDGASGCDREIERDIDSPGHLRRARGARASRGTRLKQTGGHSHQHPGFKIGSVSGVSRTIVLAVGDVNTGGRVGRATVTVVAPLRAELKAFDTCVGAEPS
jgi:hypothetical protein